MTARPRWPRRTGRWSTFGPIEPDGNGWAQRHWVMSARWGGRGRYRTQTRPCPTSAGKSRESAPSSLDIRAVVRTSPTTASRPREPAVGSALHPGWRFRRRRSPPLGRPRAPEWWACRPLPGGRPRAWASWRFRGECGRSPSYGWPEPPAVSVAGRSMVTDIRNPFRRYPSGPVADSGLHGTKRRKRPVGEKVPTICAAPSGVDGDPPGEHRPARGGTVDGEGAVELLGPSAQIVQSEPARAGS